MIDIPQKHIDGYIHASLKHGRFLREYIETSPSLLSNLEAFAEYGPSKETARTYHRDVYGYFERSIQYEDCCDLLLYDLRKGVDIHVNCAQLKEILRLRHMVRKFDEILNKEEYPKDFQGMGDYIEGHPQWKRMSAQANRILGHLRIKKTSKLEQI